MPLPLFDSGPEFDLVTQHQALTEVKVEIYRLEKKTTTP